MSLKFLLSLSLKLVNIEQIKPNVRCYTDLHRASCLHTCFNLK